MFRRTRIIIFYLRDYKKKKNKIKKNYKGEGYFFFVMVARGGVKTVETGSSNTPFELDIDHAVTQFLPHEWSLITTYLLDEKINTTSVPAVLADELK